MCNHTSQNETHKDNTVLIEPSRAPSSIELVQTPSSSSGSSGGSSSDVTTPPFAGEPISSGSSSSSDVATPSFAGEPSSSSVTPSFSGEPSSSVTPSSFVEFTGEFSSSPSFMEPSPQMVETTSGVSPSFLDGFSQIEPSIHHEYPPPPINSFEPLYFLFLVPFSCLLVALWRYRKKKSHIVSPRDVKLKNKKRVPSVNSENPAVNALHLRTEVDRAARLLKILHKRVGHLPPLPPDESEDEGGSVLPTSPPSQTNSGNEKKEEEEV